MTRSQQMLEFVRLIEYLDRNFKMNDAFCTLLSQGSAIVLGLN